MTPPREPLDWIDRAVFPVLGYVAAAVVLAMMLLTTLDVAGRYLLNKPIWGAFEITEMLLAALIFAGLPLVTLRNEHITVDLFDPVTPEWLFRIQHVVACIVGAVCTGYLSWRLWIRASGMLASGETTAQLKIPLGWLCVAMSALMAFTALALAILVFRHPRRHHTGEV
jgi:TRAP-type C4-dicarboxylate transport system permease small subunit